MIAELEQRAGAVLADNWRGRYTVPSRHLYPHQWSWDSAFVALGLRHLSAERARLELETLFDAQWPDGRVPQIVFDPDTPTEAYFPGPRFWFPDGPLPTPVTSALVQPPVHALAALEVFRSDPFGAREHGFVERIYPKLCAWHDYLRERRDLGGTGLVSVVHPWESGMDNSPTWDGPLAAVRPVAAGSFQRRDLGGHNTAERPTEDDYRRYVRLAGSYRDAGFVDTLQVHRFAVEDPLTNGLLAVAESALADLAAEIGADPDRHRREVDRLTTALLDRLYDHDAGIFFARDVHTGELIRQYTIAGLAPLVVPGLPVAASLVKTALGERFRLGDLAPVPSYDLTAPDWDPARYWRGPAWFNTGWLIWRGLLEHAECALAEQLRAGLLDAVVDAGFREYVDPLSGRGHGSDQFSWTAAIAIDLIESERHG